MVTLLFSVVRICLASFSGEVCAQFVAQKGHNWGSFNLSQLVLLLIFSIVLSVVAPLPPPPPKSRSSKKVGDLPDPQEEQRLLMEQYQWAKEAVILAFPAFLSGFLIGILSRFRL